jgi:hypothetical protein
MIYPEIGGESAATSDVRGFNRQRGGMGFACATNSASCVAEREGGRSHRMRRESLAGISPFNPVARHAFFSRIGLNYFTAPE